METLPSGLKKFEGSDNASRENFNGAIIEPTDALFHELTGHKHSGVEGDAPKIATSGLVDGAATDAIIGNRTIDDSVVAASGADTPTRLWSKLANMIKQITGKSNWYTSPAASIETLNTRTGDASTSAKGIVQLDNSTSSTSTTKAATPASVKAAKDAADAIGVAQAVHVAETATAHGGIVPSTRTVNSKALNANIILTNSDIGLGNVGNYGIATQAEAEAGASAVKYMTPQRTKQYVDTRLENGLEFRVNAGTLEYLSGGVWQSVGGLTSPDWLADLDIFNDGTDGVFNPTTTTVLTSGIYRYSSLNIPTGVTISPSGSYLVILVDGVANISGTISASGKGSMGGSAHSSDTDAQKGLDGLLAGGAGGSGGGRGSGGNDSGAGGNGGTTEVAGGARVFGANNGLVGANTFLGILQKQKGLELHQDFRGGGGGAGVGYEGGIVGGAGGAGGGVIILIAKSITGAGAIRADGLTGSNGGLPAPSTNNYSGGGGGGGGGGMVVVVTNGVLPALTTTTNGGGGGIGANNQGTITGKAGNGGAGGSGFVLKIER